MPCTACFQIISNNVPGDSFLYARLNLGFAKKHRHDYLEYLKIFTESFEA